MKNPVISLYRQTDKLIIKSKGCHVFDSDNKIYIDFESGDWAANLGHSNDRIIAVIKEQADLLIHDGLRFRNEPSEELSFKLLETLSFTDGKCAFLNSGSEAVNLGITIAKNLTGRSKVLKMDCSFLSSYGHGQISSFNKDLLSIPMNDISSLSQFNFQEIAVFVFEPGNSWGLIKFPDKEFISAVATVVRQKGGLLMVNEVTTGFGRTGKWFGFQHYDYKPDIVSMGKALGNGYPISGIAVNSEVSILFNNNPFRYAQSHQNDPLGCAIGCEVIKIIGEEGLVSQSFEKGQYFIGQLLKLKDKYPDLIKEVRGRGLMIALEFYPSIKAENIYDKLIDEGLLVGSKENIIRFMPPLVINHVQIDILVSAIEKIIGHL